MSRLDHVYSAVPGWGGHLGVAVHAGDVVAELGQGNSQGALAAACFSDAGRRSRKQRCQVGEGVGHGNCCQNHLHE